MSKTYVFSNKYQKENSTLTKVHINRFSLLNYDARVWDFWQNNGFDKEYEKNYTEGDQTSRKYTCIGFRTNNNIFKIHLIIGLLPKH